LDVAVSSGFCDFPTVLCSLQRPLNDLDIYQDFPWRDPTALNSTSPLQGSALLLGFGKAKCLFLRIFSGAAGED
jgi:hypothetical protein